MTDETLGLMTSELGAIKCLSRDVRLSNKTRLSSVDRLALPSKQYAVRSVHQFINNDVTVALQACNSKIVINKLMKSCNGKTEDAATVVHSLKYNCTSIHLFGGNI